MSRLQPGFHSYSVPTSPAVSRSSKNNPVTPQRVPRQQHRHTQSFYRSPITPSTPYTPLSLRSSDSNNSSTLTTPDNFSLSLKKRFAFTSGSPDISRANTSQDKNIPNATGSWRSRASENGIKVSSNEQSLDEQHYGDDEATEFSISDCDNDSNILASEALLPAFLSRQQSENSFPQVPSRVRAYSQASLAPRSQPLSPTVYRNGSRQAPVSPLRSRQSQNQPISLLSTPPPNRNLVKELKLKGSVTDPAHTRRREAFGVARAPQNAHSSFNFGHSNEVSTELFDIDEHEYEQETNHDMPHEDGSFSLNLQAHQANTFGYLNYNNYPSFPPYNPDPFQNTGIQLGYAAAPTIADSVEHHFPSFQQQQRQQNTHRYDTQGFRDTSKKLQSARVVPPYVRPTQVPLPSAELSLPTLHKPTPFIPSRNAISMILPSASDSISPEPSGSYDCSVCLSQHASSLAILKPCGHPLCSACLTSALNIVGEKDMECAVCKQGVQDFKLIVNSKTKGTDLTDRPDTMAGRSFFDPIFSSPSSSNTAERPGTLPESDSFGELENGFDFGIDFSPNDIRASTPKLEGNTSMNLDSGVQLTGNVPQQSSKAGAVVLRIDNVPWDITPSQVVAWLQQPVERVHVLLDRKGKTLSHAYVEIKDQTTAGAILRGEGIGPDGKKKDRSSVLGRGRRARGVTITRSGQEELMADLFPHWRGRFDGSRPSLVGLQGDRILGALEGGLLTENEVTGLLYLIREPDSHFLKVPSLPFHSLISILSKFPCDVDSRVFWSAGVRDLLFDVAIAATETLLSRLDTVKDETKAKHGYSMSLVTELVRTVASCPAFTSQQMTKLLAFASSKSIPIPKMDDDHLQEPTASINPSGEIKDQNGQRFVDLAQEFGVEAELVQALAQRLAGLS